MSKPSAPRNCSLDTDVVVEIAAAGGADDAGERSATRLDREPAARFKRRSERARTDVGEQDLAGSLGGEDDLKLQVMLLQEENARLKAARYKPADQGSMIEQVRTLAAADQASELLDETWSILGECLALREGLDRACIEIQAAMGAVRERLSNLGIAIESIERAKDPAQHADHASLSA